MWSPHEKRQPHICHICKSDKKKNKHSTNGKKLVKRKMNVADILEQNIEDHVINIMDDIVDT